MEPSGKTRDRCKRKLRNSENRFNNLDMKRLKNLSYDPEVKNAATDFYTDTKNAFSLIKSVLPNLYLQDLEKVETQLHSLSIGLNRLGSIISNGDNLMADALEFHSNFVSFSKRISDSSGSNIGKSIDKIIPGLSAPNTDESMDKSNDEVNKSSGASIDIGNIGVNATGHSTPSTFFQLFYTYVRWLPHRLRIVLIVIFSMLFLIYLVWNALPPTTKDSLIEKFFGNNIRSDRIQDDIAVDEKLKGESAPSQWQEVSRPSENEVFLREASASELFESIKSIRGVPPLEYESLLRKTYYGKVRWEVTVESLRNSSLYKGGVSVEFSDRRHGKGLGYMDVYFSEKWRPYLEQLRPGDQIRFEGLIWDIVTEGVLSIKEGRLLAFRRERKT